MCNNTYGNNGCGCGNNSKNYYNNGCGCGNSNGNYYNNGCGCGRNHYNNTNTTSYNCGCGCNDYNTNTTSDCGCGYNATSAAANGYSCNNYNNGNPYIGNGCCCGNIWRRSWAGNLDSGCWSNAGNYGLSGGWKWRFGGCC